MIVAFGSHPGSYYIGHGRSFCAEGLPPSLTNELKDTLNPLVLRWLSIAGDGKTWAAEELLGGQTYWDNILPDQIKAAFNGNGRQKCDYVSFAEGPAAGNYFLRQSGGTGWTAELADPKVRGAVQKIQAAVPNFDSRIQRILFGKGGTTIFVFEGSIWHAELSDEANSPDHPLLKALSQHAEDDWVLAQGSALSLYDSRHFVLVFQKGDQIQVHASGTPELEKNVKDLLALVNTPAEQAAIAKEEAALATVIQQRQLQELQQAQLQAQLAQQRMGIMASMNDSLNQTMINAGNSFKVATGGWKWA